MHRGLTLCSICAYIDAVASTCAAITPSIVPCGNPTCTYRQGSFCISHSFRPTSTSRPATYALAHSRRLDLCAVPALEKGIIPSRLICIQPEDRSWALFCMSYQCSGIRKQSRAAMIKCSERGAGVGRVHRPVHNDWSDPELINITQDQGKHTAFVSRYSK